MSRGRHTEIGLALLAHELDRDLQRPARAVGGPEALWSASPQRWEQLLRRPEAAAARRALDARAVRVAAARLESDGTTVVPLAALPTRVATTFDPPFAVFAAGQWAPLARALECQPVIALVGSRRATPAGLRFAEGLAADLAQRGAVVVSGMAVGVDAAAHRGALAVGGLTLGVLGCGLAHDYPRANRGLRRQVEQHGAVISEYWCDTRPAPWRFPARNRIVAALAHATVVVEARARSGALITADFSLEAGRVALAVPGSPWMDASQGCNDLIRAGAGVCCSADDVVAEVAHPGWRTAEAVSAEEPTGVAATVYALVRDAPRRVDQIAAAASLTVADTAVAVADLELAGLVARGAGQTIWAVPSPPGVAGVAMPSG